MFYCASYVIRWLLESCDSLLLTHTDWSVISHGVRFPAYHTFRRKTIELLISNAVVFSRGPDRTVRTAVRSGPDRSGPTSEISRSGPVRTGPLDRSGPVQTQKIC